MWRLLISLGSRILGKAGTVGRMSVGSSIAKYGKSIWNRVVRSASGGAGKSTSLSTMLSNSVSSFGPKQAASLGRSSMWRSLSDRFKKVIGNKTFQQILMFETAAVAIEYLMDEHGMSDSDARILVTEMKKYGTPGDFVSPYDADSTDDLRRFDNTRLGRKLSSLVQFRVAGDTEASDLVIADLYDPVDRAIVIGKLVDALEVALSASSVHASETHEKANRLAAVRSLLHGNPYNGSVYEGETGRRDYELGLDMAMSNIILADKDMPIDMIQSLIDDYDNWFDFDDVDKDSEYWSQLRLASGVSVGIPTWFITELNFDKTDTHEAEIMKDLEPALFDQRFSNTVKNQIRN